MRWVVSIQPLAKSLKQQRGTYSHSWTWVIINLEQARFGISWNPNAVSCVFVKCIYTWKLIRQHIHSGDLKSYNRSRSQALVVNLLLSQIKRRNRDSATFKLVHSFCRIYLPFGYDHRLSEEPTSIATSSSSATNRRSRSKSMSNSSESKKSNGFIASKFDIFKLSRKWSNKISCFFFNNATVICSFTYQ